MTKAKGGKKAAKAVKKSETRDISAYVCRAMVYGVVCSHGIQRAEMERLCERYSDENPSVDVTQMPMFMWTDDGKPENHAVVALVKKWCGGCSTESSDGKTVLVVGKAAGEIVSKLDISHGKARKLKTKIRIECPFPFNSKLKCFGGERVSDYIAPRRQSKELK